jgi:hypothetical protein
MVLFLVNYQILYITTDDVTPRRMHGIILVQSVHQCHV